MSAAAIYQNKWQDTLHTRAFLTESVLEEE